MAREHNMADYFTKNHPISHYQEQQSTYLLPTADARKYACYMSHIDLLGCVESLLSRGDGRRKDRVYLLHGNETDDRQMETNRSNK